MPEIKPLTTKSEEEKKKKHRGNVIMGIIIAVIMIASTIGFALLESERVQEQPENLTTYRNYTFIKTETGWQTQFKINDKDIILNSFNLPQDVENISMQGSLLLADFFNRVIFITVNNATDAEKQAAMEYNALGKVALRMQLACSKANENSSFCIENNLPVKSCDDADWQNTIIILEELAQDSNDSATINYKSSCLEIKGKKDDLIKANEKALFKIFGIIE